MTKTLTILLLLATSLTWACKSDGDKGGDDKAGGGEGLEMTSDSAVCKKAMACCVALVKSEKGDTKIEDINLKCSGVALASTDDDCTQFQKGYAMAFESKSKEVPAECK